MTPKQKLNTLKAIERMKPTIKVKMLNDGLSDIDDLLDNDMLDINTRKTLHQVRKQVHSDFKKELNSEGGE